MKTFVKLDSNNRKLGVMAATYRTQDSCPTSCPLMGNGCYAEHGWKGVGAFRIAERYGPKDDLAKLAALAGQLPRNGWLRLNVSGDFLSEDGTPDMAYIDACNEIARRRPDVQILAYTHAWRILTPDTFRFVVNASCETATEVEDARAAGWQTALADPGGEDTLIGQRVAGVPVVRCPAEYRDVHCNRCGACAVDTRTRPTIAFVTHGSRRKVAARVITEKREREEST